MKNLKELREYNNLSQKEVAEHIGVSSRVYSYYECGRKLPAKYIKPLANLFCISCDELLENKDKYKCMWDMLKEYVEHELEEDTKLGCENFALVDEDILDKIRKIEDEFCKKVQ